MNSENSKTSELYVLILKLTDKLDLEEVKKVLLYQILVFTIHGQISAPTWNGKFQLPDEPCSVSDIQDYFEYILKNLMKRLIMHQ